MGASLALAEPQLGGVPSGSVTADKYFFVHLQKTAGTTLYLMMRRHLGHPAVYPDKSDGEGVDRVLGVTNLKQTLARRGDEIQVITGHYPLATAELLDGTFRTFTVLREPVARTRSFIRHQRVLDPTRVDLSDSEIYTDPFLFNGLVHNHMVKMLALKPDELDDYGALANVEMTHDHLERAKQRLTNDIEVLGVQEDFVPFIRAIESRFGWDLGEINTANTTTAKPERTAEDDELDARIRVENALDCELYDFAVELLATRGPFSN